jgi:hypothetical protein
MTFARIALQVLLRTAVLAIGLVAYDRGYDQVVTPTRGDADIGKGLLAFLLVVGVSLVWAFVDGLRNKPVVWAVVWVVTAIGVGVGWALGSRLVGDNPEPVDLEAVSFTTQLVLWPALFAAGFAWLVAGRRSSSSPGAAAD